MHTQLGYISTYMYLQQALQQRATHRSSVTEDLLLGQQMADATQKDRKGGFMPSCSPSSSSQ